ncbi:hypothetical protein PsorP6_011940 [Peronosclerospora sorghi]|uniref:Uncharacterized protein n=1 Tax=Peronosclerospora sorghi TaxID=230839 RepID=A0ACC0WKY7_9STRA|nr:hypothetical protein PsorP6_011940 [Peronosclerospora sorghi]
MRRVQTVQWKPSALSRHGYEAGTLDRRVHVHQEHEKRKMRRPHVVEKRNPTWDEGSGSKGEKERRHRVAVAALDKSKERKRKHEPKKEETSVIRKSMREKGGPPPRPPNLEEKEKKRDHEPNVPNNEPTKPLVIVLSSDEEEDEKLVRALRRSTRGKRQGWKSLDTLNGKSEKAPVFTKRKLPRVEVEKEESILVPTSDPTSKITHDTVKDTAPTSAALEDTQGILLNEKNTLTVSSVEEETQSVQVNEKNTPNASSPPRDTPNALINDKEDALKSSTVPNGIEDSLLNERHTPILSSVSNENQNTTIEGSETSTSSSFSQRSWGNEKNTPITGSSSPMDEKTVTTSSNAGDTQKRLMNETNESPSSSASDDTQTKTNISRSVPDTVECNRLNEKETRQLSAFSDDRQFTLTTVKRPTSSVSENLLVTPANAKKKPCDPSRNQTGGNKRKYMREVPGVSKPSMQSPSEVQKRPEDPSVPPRPSSTLQNQNPAVPDALRSAIAEVVSQRRELLSRSQRGGRSRSSSGSDSGRSDKHLCKSRASSSKCCSVDTSYSTRSKTGLSIGLMPPLIDKYFPTDNLVNIGRKREGKMRAIKNGDEEVGTSPKEKVKMRQEKATFKVIIYQGETLCIRKNYISWIMENGFWTSITRTHS